MAERGPWCNLHDQPAGSCIRCFEEFYEAQGREDLRFGRGYTMNLGLHSGIAYKRGWDEEAARRTRGKTEVQP